MLIVDSTNAMMKNEMHVFQFSVLASELCNSMSWRTESKQGEDFRDS